jgi:hypothetical protein
MKQTRSQPLIMSGHADREARAKELVTLFVKFLGDHVDLIVRVRRDFLDKPKTQTIMGCHTFGEYCRNVLHYSEQHIRRLIAGRNPATAIYDGSKNRTTALIDNGADDGEDSWVQRLHREGGFVRRCEDPVLRALVLEQARLLDEDAVGNLPEAAYLDAQIVGHICLAARMRKAIQENPTPS